MSTGCVSRTASAGPTPPLRGSSPRRGRPANPDGFTLLEVVMALLILEVGVLGVLGTLVVASETMRRAERLERATARVESVLDSLARGAAPASATDNVGDVRVSWTVDAVGRVSLRATDEDGGPLLTVQSRVPLR